MLDEGQYTFDIHGAQIFPNDQLKYSILIEHDRSVYITTALTFAIMGHTINSSNVQINIQPAMIDDTETRLNLEIYAAKADVTGTRVSKSYNNLETRSVYGIYDRITEKMMVPRSIWYCIITPTTIVD